MVVFVFGQDICIFQSDSYLLFLGGGRGWLVAVVVVVEMVSCDWSTQNPGVILSTRILCVRRNPAPQPQPTNTGAFTRLSYCVYQHYASPS
jgi:hypothetical protein